ncbi:MAG: efflux RND transporter periplasmic adaptor subunit [Hyphomonas sp.]|nr:efflux RND transporter periplasmic adaptor subunit [Hyphomonas sp.]
MGFDVVILLGAFICIAVSAWIGFGFALLSTLLLLVAVSTGAVLAEHAAFPNGMLPVAYGMIVWLLVGGLAGVAMTRKRRTRSLGRMGGAALGLLQAVIVAVLAVGVIQQRIGPIDEILASRSYLPIAALGNRLDAWPPASRLSFPQPVQRAAEPAPEPHLRPVQWAEATVHSGTAERAVTGSVRTAERARIGFEVGGRVSEVLLNIGDVFEPGQVLARLDPHLLEIALEERQAALVEAEAWLVEAQQQYDRQRTLFDRNIVADAALERAEAALKSTQSRHRMVLSGIESAQDRLDDTTLTAPYGGSIAARLIEPSQVVAAGEPVFEILSEGAGFEIVTAVPETLLSRLDIGSQHRAILLHGSNFTVQATVTEIGARANAATGFPVTLSVDSDAETIRAGMTAEVILTLRGRVTDPGILEVPLNAVFAGDGDERAVFVHDFDSSTVRYRAIDVAGTEDEMALVSGGLAEGEIVVTRGVAFLRDGDAVALLNVGVARYDQ